MIKVNDTVPLSLQLFDGNPDQKVFVVVVGPSGTVIFDGILTHKVGGLYQSDELKMPSLPFIIASYLVDSDDYSKASETFYLCEYEEITRSLLDEDANRPDNYYQGVVTNIESDDFLEGVTNGIFEAQAS